jgi:tetratricopeptide (TPR) repeat protein
LTEVLWKNLLFAITYFGYDILEICGLLNKKDSRTCHSRSKKQDRLYLMIFPAIFLIVIEKEKRESMSTESKERVFLSYAHENLEMVRKIHAGLIKRNLDVWFDKVNMVPGSWKKQIEKAIPKSRYFIICISEAALKKIGDASTGFQDEELQQAYEIARVQPESSFTIIPLRLEDCDRGDHRTSPYQQYDLFEDFEAGLDHLALDLGGMSLSDRSAKDTRSDDEKLYWRLVSKGESLYLAKNYAVALSLFEAAYKIGIYDSFALISKAWCLCALGRNDEALEDFDKVIKSGVDDYYAWSYKGELLARLSRHKEAIEAFSKAIEIYPNHVHTWNGKGKSLSALGQMNEAQECFSKEKELQQLKAARGDFD